MYLCITNQLVHQDTLPPAVPDTLPPAVQGNRHTQLAAVLGSRAVHSPVEGEEDVHSPAVEVGRMLAVHTAAARILAVLEGGLQSSQVKPHPLCVSCCLSLSHLILCLLRSVGGGFKMIVTRCPLH